MKKIILFIAIVSVTNAVSQTGKLKTITIDSLKLITDDFIGYDKFAFYYYIKDL